MRSRAPRPLFSAGESGFAESALGFLQQNTGERSGQQPLETPNLYGLLIEVSGLLDIG